MKKIIFSAVLLSIISSMVVAVSYVKPEKEVIIAPGISARASAAEEMKDLGIADDVIKLYNKDIDVMGNSVTVVRGMSSLNSCIVLLIETRGGKKGSIYEVSNRKKEECLK